MTSRISNNNSRMVTCSTSLIGYMIMLLQRKIHYINPIYSIHLHPKFVWCRGFRVVPNTPFQAKKNNESPQLPSKHLALPGSNNFSSRLLLDSHLSRSSNATLHSNESMYEICWNYLYWKLTYKRPSINTAVWVSITNLKRKCDIPRIFCWTVGITFI